MSKPTEHTPGSVKLAEEIVSSIWFNVQGRLDIVDNIATMIDAKITGQQAKIDRLRKVAKAALAYDKVIRSCANDPDKMSTYCTARGDSLDVLYDNLMAQARAALKPESETKP